MKDMLKIMRFDFLTAADTGYFPAIFLAALSMTGSFLFGPSYAAALILTSICFIIPLTGVTEKSELHKLYGILPVNRKNITRGRFLYIFLLHFIPEMIALILIKPAFSLKAYRYLPNQGSTSLQMIGNAFSSGFRGPCMIIFLVFSLSCFIFLYLEFTGQLFGHENDLKSIMILLTAVTAVSMTVILLGGNDIIHVDFQKIKNLSTLTVGTGANVLMLIICVLLGEITAGKVSAKEL